MNVPVWEVTFPGSLHGKASPTWEKMFAALTDGGRAPESMQSAWRSARQEAALRARLAGEAGRARWRSHEGGGAGGGASQDPSGLQARERPDCALAIARLDVTRAHSRISASRYAGKQTGVPRTPLRDPNTKPELRSGHPCARDPAEGVGRMWWGEFSGRTWARGPRCWVRGVSQGRFHHLPPFVSATASDQHPEGASGLALSRFPKNVAFIEMQPILHRHHGSFSQHPSGPPRAAVTTPGPRPRLQTGGLSQGPGCLATCQTS